MRVLLTHSYFLRFDPKQWKLMQPYPPLGTLYAAAALRHSGFHVALHDVMFAEGPMSIEDAIATFRPEMLVIYDDGFNYLTKMCLTNMREAALTMCEIGKKHRCTIVVSSSDAADHYDKYLDRGADFVIIGEGEKTIAELACNIRKQTCIASDIPGLIFRDSGNNTIHTAARPVSRNPDDIPMPAWDLVKMEQYREAWLSNHGYFSINVSTTRGCPFKCNWCAKPIYGQRYNVRSPEHVAAELNMLKNIFHFDHVWFCDDIFGLKPGWIKNFATSVAGRKLKFRFKIQSRADILLKDQQVAHLALAGCETVWLGAESGSQRILDAMDKGVTIEQIEKATWELKNHQISVGFFLQFGYPGELKEDIEATLAMIRRLKPDDIGISISYPLPGTKFYDKVKTDLKSKTNWTDSDDMAMMFHGTYSATFYKKLHRYVHTFFRAVKTAERLQSNRHARLTEDRPGWKDWGRLLYFGLREKWQRYFIDKVFYD